MNDAASDNHLADNSSGGNRDDALESSWKRIDQFGSQIALTQFSKDSHRTCLGSICTLLIYPFLIFLYLEQIIFVDFSVKDVVSEVTDLVDNPSAVRLFDVEGEGKESQLVNFRFHVNDKSFDNNDNPYGRVELQFYSNM